MKESEFTFLMVGFVLGNIVLSLIIWASDATSFSVQKAKEDCEKSLPRDQHCYIIAVPPNKD